MNETIALDDLALFVTVAREASFAAAARRSRVPPSTVSRVVARLEVALGVRLFQRTSRRVALTEDGRQLLLETAPLVEGLTEVVHGLADRRSEPVGVVRVTAPAFTGATRVATALAALARAHPGLVFELDASNARRDLVAERFDLGIRVGPVSGADLVVRRLWEGTRGLFASPALARRLPRVLDRAALAEVPAVALRRDTTWRFVDDAGRSAEVKPRIVFAVNDPRAAVDVARHGVGVVVVPREAALGLVELRTALGTPEPQTLYLVYPSQRLLPRRVRVTIDWLVAHA